MKVMGELHNSPILNLPLLSYIYKLSWWQFGSLFYTAKYNERGKREERKVQMYTDEHVFTVD